MTDNYTLGQESNIFYPEGHGDLSGRTFGPDGVELVPEVPQDVAPAVLDVTSLTPDQLASLKAQLSGLDTPASAE